MLYFIRCACGNLRLAPHVRHTLRRRRRAPLTPVEGHHHGRDLAMIDPDAHEDMLYQSELVEPDWYKTNIPCQVGCPAHTDVANYIGLISQGRFDEAYVLNRQCNVVPGVLGRTCARPCEPVCRRNKIDGNPVAICWLKRAAHDHREFRHLPERPADHARQEGRRHRRRVGWHGLRARAGRDGLSPSPSTICIPRRAA